MKVICIGNYPPRQCGIATFTENLVNAIRYSAAKSSNHLELEVIAMNDSNQSYDYPPIVRNFIHDKSYDAYIKMADYVNHSGADILLLQHEYGIYGGESGVLLLGLLRRIKIPIVTTLHTVLLRPSFHQKEVLKKITDLSSKVVIMNNMAIGFLTEIYDVPKQKIIRIEHGVPDFEANSNQLIAPPENWNNRKVMLTFGLIGRSKGIETVIKALPDIVAKHPDILYVVLGKTHPSIVKHAGEEYREYLHDLVHKLKLENNVVFMNQYVSELELMSLLKAAVIYVTPYLNKAQITSGTLSYAVSGGCAVFSTPYWHAEELLANNRGKLFDFEDHKQLSEIVLFSLDHPAELQMLQQNAFSYGKNITWPKIGDTYLSVFESSMNEFSKINKKIKRKYPEPDLAHLVRLTDYTGILQHAQNSVPSYLHGYCLDDNARAILVVLMAANKIQNTAVTDLLYRYMAYMNLMLQKDGSFNNYLSFNRISYEAKASDDAYGRAIWALGSIVRFAPNDSLFQPAHEMFHFSLLHLNKINYARGYANCIFGFYHYVKRYPDQDRFIRLIEQMADALCNQYKRHYRDNWHWFEDSLTYDNGLIPAALYHAYEITRKEIHLEIADASRKFLEKHCFRNSWLSLVGNKKWLRFDSDYELYAQQPIDAMAMVFMYESAYQCTKNTTYLSKMFKSFDWFFGDNDLCISLYDDETKGCNDGIEPMNVNRNQGAESVIAYLLARYIIDPHLE